MGKVSIIVPVYNAEPYINQALKSICEQTYQNLEIILIDDGSKDASLARCKEWVKKDERIKVYTQENAGVSVTRNRGLELATGEYIMFMDGDDWIEKNMVEVLCGMIQTYGTDAACCVLQENQLSDAVDMENVSDENLEDKILLGANQEESGLLLLKVWGPVCKLYRREVIRDLRFECFEVAEDLLFNTNVICSGKLQKVAFVDYPFYHYIIYPGSTMKQQFQEKYLTAMEIEEKCYEMLTEISPKFADINLVGCSVSRVFEKYAQLSSEERKKHKKAFAYCKKFAKKHKKQLLGTTNRHRKISGMLKVYIPDIYLQILIRRYRM